MTRKSVATVLIATAAFLGVIATVSADPIDVGDYMAISSSSGGYGGGPFKLTVYDGTNPAVVKGSYLAFCLERTESISYGVKYHIYDVSDSAFLGSTGSSDPLDITTAFLFYQWTEAAIPGTVLGHAVTGREMQVAIWKLEGEGMSGISGADQTAADLLISWAVANMGSVDWLSLVTAINPGVNGSITRDSRTGQVQSMLVRVPEPLSVLFLGAGLLGLAVLKRNRG